MSSFRVLALPLFFEEETVLLISFLVLAMYNISTHQNLIELTSQSLNNIITVFCCQVLLFIFLKILLGVFNALNKAVSILNFSKYCAKMRLSSFNWVIIEPKNISCICRKLNDTITKNHLSRR